MSTPVSTGNGDVGFPSGTSFATDVVGTDVFPISKLDVGGPGASSPVTAANPLPVDTSDRVGRILGVIKSITDALDISDRVGRILGHVQVDNFPATQPISGSVAVSNFPATQVVSAAAWPLSANAAQETGGNLAALVAKDFSTSAKQDTINSSIATLDTDLKAEIGAVSPSPGAYTVLDRLAMNTQSINALAKSVATEVTMRKVLAALSKPVPPTYSTLLHR